jgi:hypothetical protein
MHPARLAVKAASQLLCVHAQRPLEPWAPKACDTVEMHKTYVNYWLPYSKVDRFYKGEDISMEFDFFTDSVNYKRTAARLQNISNIVDAGQQRRL